ncbi:receptor-interacting serine/threonine-protein kinase 4 [Austrofundulus limnaeus]|uniref:Receptor-interacting serine/threonine-protein kinase 4 n=1 Tax=Austrofundulus limnaeus TaxID=52670 RepID=A0A2I4BJ93_AUSLI|nr:PREDICTED: receptor-interacting serine/threonine-protein kinase 4-like [Austrofundulus limnaeus]
MAEASSEVIHDTDLEEWKEIGCGGFGRIYRVWHKTWGLDVAIKLPHQESSLTEDEPLLKEANHMKSLVFDFVLRIYGMYDGTPFKGMSRRRGIVMEHMKRGSIETLQENLAGPPPPPLAFRLAHQVAQGINFLHLKKILHCDLKPSNVLLTDELHAKLADFGLSRITTSVSNIGDQTRDVGGTFKYMPPEALGDLSYIPCRSFDIYSYGILLWSIFTGQEPYQGKGKDLVAVRIPKGDRPDVKRYHKNVERMEELVKLMKQCWDGDPVKRPKSEEIMARTKDVFSKHQSNVNVAVYEVLLKLDSPAGVHLPQTSGADSVTKPENACAKDVVAVDHYKFSIQDLRVRDKEHSAQDPSQAKHRDTQVQQPDKVTPKMTENVCTKKEKATFIDDMRPELIQRTSQVMAVVEELRKRVHSEAYSMIRAEKTSQDKMRELYGTTLRSGESAKAAFYDALKKHEPDLMKELGALF